MLTEPKINCLRLKLPSKPRNVAEYWYSRKLLLFFTSISCSLCFCLILISFFDFSTDHFFLAFHPVHLISSSPWLYMDKCIILGRKRELPGLRSMVLVDMHDHDSLRPLAHLAYHRRWYDAVETKYISVDASVSI